MNMTEQLCIYAAQRDEVVIAYLYDEMPADERPTFERHLTLCARCRSDVDALRGVRLELQQWHVSGAPSVSVAGPRPVLPRSRLLWPRFHDASGWARSAAAVFLFGAGLGLANLEVSYTASGLSVQTGWRHVDESQAAAVSPGLSGETAAPIQPAAFQSDLERLADEVHSVRDRQHALGVAAQNDQDVLRRVRDLIQASEQRQQRELALRVAEVTRDVQTQRQADLVRIDRSLGIIQNRTGMEVMRTQQQVNSLAQRVSQRQ